MQHLLNEIGPLQTQSTVVAFHRNRQLYEQVDCDLHAADNLMVMMPPFTEKIVALCYLNGFLSVLNSVPLLKVFDVNQWCIQDNMKPSVRTLFTASIDFDDAFNQLPTPKSDMPRQRFETCRPIVKRCLERLMDASQSPSWNSIIRNSYVYDHRNLVALQQIIGSVYPFCGIMNMQSSQLTAWLYIRNNSKGQQCLKRIRNTCKMKKLSQNLNVFEITHSAASESISGLVLCEKNYILGHFFQEERSMWKSFTK
jgi:hypothetical protein